MNRIKIISLIACFSLIVGMFVLVSYLDQQSKNDLVEEEIIDPSEVPLKAFGSGNTYYVSSSSGSDENDGLLESSPWQTLDKVSSFRYSPGDTILFKSGDTWEGSVRFTGSGSESSPINVSSYGGSALPRIDGNGTNEEIKMLFNENLAVSGAVELVEGSYWRISNLEVTNYNPNVKSLRAGILVKDDCKTREAYSGTPQTDITIADCYVHDVDSDPVNKRAGGILVFGNINNVTIDGNTIENVSVAGIRNTAWVRSVFGKEKEYYVKNYKISNNTLRKTYGDGIVLDSVLGGLMEYNTVDQFCVGDPNKNYAGMWVWSCKDVTIQYNEVCNGAYAKNDAASFDVDFYNENTTIQYNYSHGNQKGFCLFPLNSTGTVFRYNISVNDGQSSGAHIFSYGSPTSEFTPLIYNNIIYQDPDTYSVGYLMSNYTSGYEDLYFKFFNNIVVSSGGLQLTNKNISYGKLTNNIFVPKMFRTKSMSETDVSHDNLEIETLPFGNVSIPRGSEPSNLITSRNTFDSNKLAMFKLDEDTEAVSFGAPIDSSLLASIKPETVDFFGNPVNRYLDVMAVGISQENVDVFREEAEIKEVETETELETETDIKNEMDTKDENETNTESETNTENKADTEIETETIAEDQLMPNNDGTEDESNSSSNLNN